MDLDEFRRHGHRLVDWMADYLANVGRYPVRAQVGPGEIAARLPAAPPAGQRIGGRPPSAGALSLWSWGTGKEKACIRKGGQLHER